LIRLISLALLLLLWEAAALFGDPRRLPGPVPVFSAIVEEASSGALFSNLAITLLRVAAAFLLAMSLGAALGYVMGRRKLIDRLFDPWIVVLLNLPALVVIVLAYIWAGLTEAAAIGAVALNKLPNAVVIAREGARALDPALDEMAQVFKLSAGARLRHILAPQLAPYIAAATRSGLSLVWKIVLVVELLGRSNGVGFEINLAFQLFDVRLLLAYALPFVALMLAVETFVVQPFERRVSRWRLGAAAVAGEGKAAASTKAAPVKRRRPPKSLSAPAPAVHERALEVSIASKDYASVSGSPKRTLQDLEFTLARGEAAALVGPSGCGKTTLLRIIAGLDRAYEGRVILPDHARLGMVFQEPRLLPWRSVEDNLRIAAPDASDEDIDSVLDATSLVEHRAHFPGELSLGLARRAALARALAIKPDLLLLDEPLVSLDAALAQELRDEIATLIDERRVTMLIVTHDLREAIELADIIFMLSPRPAQVRATLSVPTPRGRMTRDTAERIEKEARAALQTIIRAAPAAGRQT
jgi:NitT/TauT family transport system permease protein